MNIIMFCWGILALLVVIAATVGLFTHKGTSKSTQEPTKALFDFSAGQEEGKQMQRVLTASLSESETDNEFERAFKRAVGITTGRDEETAWAWLGRFLMEYRQANEFEPSPRRLAERFLQDIPRRYKLK